MTVAHGHSLHHLPRSLGDGVGVPLRKTVPVIPWALLADQQLRASLLFVKLRLVHSQGDSVGIHVQQHFEGADCAVQTRVGICQDVINGQPTIHVRDACAQGVARPCI